MVVIKAKKKKVIVIPMAFPVKDKEGDDNGL